MTKKKKPQPHLLMADKDGQLYDHPDLLMVCRRGNELTLPRPDELIPLPDESELFQLEGRHAVGFDPESGDVEVLEDYAVAAFISPGHTVCATAAYETEEDAPVLPLFSYGAIGYAEGKFWVCAKRVDEDRRQVFSHIKKDDIAKGAHRLLKKYPKNRLISHLAGCALTSCCPAARNLALGRFEAPLPTARACNARCVGCISEQPEDSGFPSPQNRIDFAPDANEICEVMFEHGSRAKKPIYSFGQGCEGEPLTEAKVIAEAIAAFRKGGGKGTVNMNTNASMPQHMEMLAKAGLNSIRASMTSVQKPLYDAYYNPVNYQFSDVVDCVSEAKKNGLFVSLNYIFFPGINDTENELDALIDFVCTHKVDFIQLRNLSMDPELYLETLDKVEGLEFGPSMGLVNFRKRLRKAADWLEFGYFNPYLGS